MQRWTDRRSIDEVSCKFVFEKNNPDSNNEVYIKAYDSNDILLAQGVDEDEVYEDIRDLIRNKS